MVEDRYMDSFMLDTAETRQHFSISCLWAKVTTDSTVGSCTFTISGFMGQAFRDGLSECAAQGPSQLCFYVHWAVFSSGGLTRGKSTFMFIAAVSGIWFLGIVGLGHSVMLLPVSRRPPPGFKGWPPSPWSSETKLFLCFVSTSLPQGLELLWYNIKSHQARS